MKSLQHDSEPCVVPHFRESIPTIRIGQKYSDFERYIHVAFGARGSAIARGSLHVYSDAGAPNGSYHVIPMYFGTVPLLTGRPIGTYE